MVRFIMAMKSNQALADGMIYIPIWLDLLLYIWPTGTINSTIYIPIWLDLL